MVLQAPPFCSTLLGSDNRMLIMSTVKVGCKGSSKLNFKDSLARTNKQSNSSEKGSIKQQEVIGDNRKRISSFRTIVN